MRVTIYCFPFLSFPISIAKKTGTIHMPCVKKPFNNKISAKGLVKSLELSLYSSEKNNEMRIVQNIFECKEKVENSIDSSFMVIDALKKLISVNLSYLIVKDNNEYKGIFCEKDYTRKLVLQGRSSRDTMVKEVMTTNLPVVTLSNTVEECMYLVNQRGSRYLAAFDNDHFVGIITINDLLREVLASKHQVFDDALTNSLLHTDESGKIF